MSQVQCENWPDLQAPKTTSVLLDLFSRVEELLVERPGTVLVHCSAGVGRTGAFLALFKLIKDYERGVSVLPMNNLMADNVLLVDGGWRTGGWGF